MRLAKSREARDRERLLLELVDLCNDNTEDLNNPRVQALLSQVFFDLVFQAEHDIRLRLADKICTADWAPAAMINILSFDDIEIARPIIAKSPILKDPDLIRILVEATLEHQVEVARRPDISALIVDAIVKGSVPEVMTALVNNQSAEITVDHLYALIREAEKVETLRAQHTRWLHPRVGPATWPSKRNAFARKWPCPIISYRHLVSNDSSHSALFSSYTASDDCC